MLLVVVGIVAVVIVDVVVNCCCYIVLVVLSVCLHEYHQVSAGLDVCVGELVNQQSYCSVRLGYPESAIITQQ